MDDERKAEERGEETGEGLKVVRNAPNLSGAKSCPACRGTVAKDAVLCVLCGYNFATGKRAARAKAKTSYLELVVLLVLLAGIGAGIWGLLDRKARAKARAEAEAVAEAQAAADAAAARQAAEAKAAEEKAAAEAAAKAAEEERIRAEAAAERELFERKRAEAREEIRRKFEAAEPMWGEGETVELRRRNGVVSRGRLVRIVRRDEGRVAVLEESGGERTDVPLEALDGPSRRRIDAEFREEWLEGYMERRLGGGGEGGGGMSEE